MRQLVSLLLMVGAVVGVGWCYYFAPFYIEHFRMGDVVGSAAMTWHALGEKKGREELLVRMRQREIDSEYLDPATRCQFYEEEGNKIVGCEWEVEVYPPLVGGRRLHFAVRKGVGANGDVVDL
jgi:hypothetical protein